MKIRKISWSIEEGKALRLLPQIFSLFGSLNKGVDGPLLAHKILGHSSLEEEKERMQNLADIREILRNWDGSQFQFPEASVLEVAFTPLPCLTLVTPTSKTRISVRSSRPNTGDFTVVVDFSEEPSRWRAEEILFKTEEIQRGEYFSTAGDGEPAEMQAILLGFFEESCDSLITPHCGGIRETEVQGFLHETSRLMEMLLRLQKEADLGPHFVKKRSLTPTL